MPFNNTVSIVFRRLSDIVSDRAILPHGYLSFQTHTKLRTKTTKTKTDNLQLNINFMHPMYESSDESLVRFIHLHEAGRSYAKD